MTLVIVPRIREAHADWDVEAELQKELDAVSISSEVSSSSSATGAEETFPPEDPERTSNPLHKLLEDWRVKERKLQSFEMLLSGTKAWKHDMLDEISVDQGQSSGPGPFDDLPDAYNEVHDLVDPIFQCEQSASNSTDSSHMYNMVSGRLSTGSSSLSQQCAFDSPMSSFDDGSPLLDISEQAGNMTELGRPVQEHDSTPKTSMPYPISPDFDDDNEKHITSYHDENDLPCSMDYEDTQSMLRKKRMRMVEEYRAEEAERFVGKNLKRLTETEESRKIFRLASRRRQELENEIWKEKQEKLSLLDLEQAKQIQLFEELQRTEERDLQTQKLDIEACSRSSVDWISNHEHLDEELELRRLEKEQDIHTTAGQENKNEQAVQIVDNDNYVKCCVLIQSWIRGFICRRKFQDLKFRNAHALVSLLLPFDSASIHEICGQEYPKSEQQEDEGRLWVSEEPTEFLHGQEYQRCGEHQESGPITTLQEGIYGNSQSPEEILTTLAELAESGSMRDFQLCLDLATSRGLFAEASEVEGQLIQRKENVQIWLDQVVQGWEATRSEIEEKIQEAKRLELYPILTVAEALVSERAKEIHDNLEASILNASRSDYTYWMRKANTFGLEDSTATLNRFSKSFHRTIKMVTSFLKREAKLGTKEKYVALFRNALSLGLQSDVNLALKILLKRVLQVFKRTILLECTSVTDVHSREQDWNTVEMEASEIGLDTQMIPKLRQTICAGRIFESVQTAWVTTFKTQDIGGSFTIIDENSDLVEEAGEAPDKQLSANSHKFSMSSGLPLSPISGDIAVPKHTTSCPLPQDWLEVNRLQRDWQQHALHLRTPGNDNYSQHERYTRWERDLHARCAGDKISEQTKNPSVRKIAKETVDLDRCLLSDDDCREEEEESSEFSESGEDLREVGQAHINEMPVYRRVTPRKSTLAREMLEEKLRCNRVELRWVMKLDLTDEHLKSLGRGQIFRWCPRLRFLTVDMNKLTTLRGVFQGDADCLEHLSVKDNLLPDLLGLECLHKLTVLHLDGNLLSQLGFPVSNHIVPNVKQKLERNEHVYVSSKNPGNLQSRLGRPVVEYCWPRLKILTVGCNRLTKILKLGNLCPNLEVLDVGSNQIFSLGCTEDNCLAGLRHLRVLDVGQNRLQGKSLWKGLENCPELVSLVASRNKLRELPNHFGSVLLREIWLNGNAIRRLSCKAWLPSLQRLYLQDNMIDTLDSLWGCPALEVLDLSFNSITEVSHLKHLSCFPCLRSLQLNDNPVSEQEDHATYVLEAVPWLEELDNEAVAKASRQNAISKIFKRAMDVIGLAFVKEKLSRGEMLVHGFSNPSGPKESCSLDNIELSDRSWCQFLPQQDVNKVLNGEADESSLWKILSEAKNLANSSSIMQNLLAMNGDMVKFEGLRRFSESELEARSTMIAYQQMAFGLKGRLQAATKETCIARLLKDWHQGPHPGVGHGPDKDHIVENARTFHDLSSESHSSSEKAGESNLESCLDEHTMFDSSKWTEVYSENKEYKLERQKQTSRVTRVQAVFRGYLARSRVRLLREQKTSMRQELEQSCACKIQAVWRGWKERRAMLLASLQKVQFRGAVIIQAHWRGYSMRHKFRQALDTAKYNDDDDFEYLPIDESEFLAGETELSAVCQPSQKMLSFMGKSSTLASKAIITPMDKKYSARPAVQGEQINPEYASHELHEVNRPGCPVELEVESTEDTVPSKALYQKVEIDKSHAIEAVGPCPTDSHSSEETEAQAAPKDEVHANQRAQEEKYPGLEQWAESEEKKENHESEERDITDLLVKIGIKSKVSMDSGDFDASEEEVSRIMKGRLVGNSQSSDDRQEDLGSSEEEASRIIKRHLGGIQQSSVGTKGHFGSSEGKASRVIKGQRGGIPQSSGEPTSRIMPDPPSLPAAEVKKREKIEELSKDWGFKNESTAQALIKARQKLQQQAKDAAHKNFLQDPEKRLKRFREKLQGQASAVGAPPRHLEKRASHSVCGLTLQMALAEQEPCKIPETDHAKEGFVRKQHGVSCPLAVPRLPHQRMEARESFEIKNNMTKPHKKNSTRDLKALHFPTVLLNTALQVTPFNNL